MKNETNIYDIDGNIIRQAGDNHKMTIDEAKEKIEEYRKKLLEVGENHPNAIKYATYMRNLSQYIASLYAKMTPEELSAEFEKNKQKYSTEEQVNKAIEELKNSLEEENDGNTEINTTEEVQGTTPNDNGSTPNEEPGDDETINRGNSDVQEERPITQSDLLVERDITDSNMDEYVAYEEL